METYLENHSDNARYVEFAMKYHMADIVESPREISQDENFALSCHQQSFSFSLVSKFLKLIISPVLILCLLIRRIPLVSAPCVKTIISFAILLNCS